MNIQYPLHPVHGQVLPASNIYWLGCRIYSRQVTSLSQTKKKDLALCKTVVGLIPCLGSLHALPVHVWGLSGYSGFLPQTKNMLTLLHFFIITYLFYFFPLLLASFTYCFLGLTKDTKHNFFNLM